MGEQYVKGTSVIYDDTFTALDWVFENKVKIYGKMSEDELYDYFDMFRTYLNNTINNILLVNKDDVKEEYIRKLCRYVIKNLLPICNKKIKFYNEKSSNANFVNSNDMIMLNKWLDMEDDLFAIASMRSLTHFALYLERDDSKDQKVWCYILNDVMGGIFYYANQMILNHKYQNLFKQCPTGYGKCCSEDTLVFTPNGYIKIKDLNIGDIVYSMEKNKLVKKQITNKWNSAKKQIKISTRSGSEIIVSPEHRMYTQRGYIQAKDISCDDYLYKLCSNNFIWDKITSIEYDNKEIPMVDIEVEDTHNFIANGLVSHNSKSDCVIISYIFGYDNNASIMKVVGNPRLVGEITENVIKMIQSQRFGKVFKKYGEITKNNKNDIFESISKKDGVFKLKYSNKARSFLCVNKDTDIDGTRYDYQFFDDITQSKDRENTTQHFKDREKFTSQWKKRASDEYSVIRFFTGTAYHREDFLSYTKKYYLHNKKPIKDIDTINFKWSKFVNLSSDKKSVYIIVPKLADLDLGEENCYCTFPQKYSKNEALAMYHGSLGSKREFFAMEQQTPLPPESLAFDYAYLNKYTKLPQDILEKNCVSKIIIDPSRKGYDNFSALVMEQSQIENTDKWYFTDCFYKKVSYKSALPEIVDLIIKHKVDVIYIENNVDYVELLKIELGKKNYTNYNLIEFFSSKGKEDKISSQRDDIRDTIIFPIQGMYYEDSDMGRAMKDIVNYSLDGRNKHDDSIDCCAMFTLQEKDNTQNEVTFFDFDFSLR